MEEMIKELIEGLNANKYKKGIDWNGYQVFIPQYEGNPCLGLPYVVLVKGEEARISNEEESLEYLDYEQSQIMEKKTSEDLAKEIRIEQTNSNNYVEKQLS